jgi:hypothetical protein
MKKIFTLIAVCAIVTSCGQTGEQSLTSEDLEIFYQLLPLASLHH